MTTEKAPHYFTIKQQEAFAKMNDESNPEFTFNGTDSKILSMIAKGEIDAKAMAMKALADSGLDHDGNWVGFKRAKAIFEAAVVQNIKL